jgi:hypothetical protein
MRVCTVYHNDFDNNDNSVFRGFQAKTRQGRQGTVCIIQFNTIFFFLLNLKLKKKKNNAQKRFKWYKKKKT